MNDFTTGQPVVFTLGEAAKAAGVSKPSLSKAIAKGRLSAERKDDGSYSIQAAELFRVYPPGNTANGSPEREIDARETGNGNSALQGEVTRLREQLTLLATERDRERNQLSDQIADLRRRLDVEGEERRKLTAVLTAPPTAPPTATPEPSRGGRGFWGRFGRRGL